jgi:two-component system, sensor histidine kinase and response regulator
MDQSGKRNARVDIIDDNESIGILLGEELSDMGYQTRNFINGETGIATIIKDPPDILLLDAVLPDIHGFDIVKRLRSEEATRLLPIILITAFLKSEDDVIRGLDYGANDYIEKPINLDILVARIRTQLRIKALQDQLEQGNKKIQQQMEDYKKLNDYKDELIGIVAHDLKSPLSNMHMLVEYLEQALNDVLDQRHNRLLQMVRSTVQNMFNLIDDILDISAIESGKLELIYSEINAADFFHGIVESHQLIADNKQIALKTDLPDPPPTLYVDPNRLTQVFDNLLSNALKFSDHDTTITMGIKNDDNQYICYVADEGMGIKKEEQDRLFRKFEKLSNRPIGNEPSTGLGLVIVKKIVELHQGEVWLESEFDKGTTVYFSIPKQEKAHYTEM